MAQLRHYNGLSDEQVAASRKRHGANVYTPREKTTLLQLFKAACRHWLGASMIALAILSLAFAAIIGSHIVAIVVPLATVLILLVGFFGGFNDPLFKILITAFLFSLGISLYEFLKADEPATIFLEPLGIIVALFLATGVAFVLDRRNEKTMESLSRIDDDTLVKVVRDGNVRQVPRRDIVVDDIVLVEAGEEVPADCRLLESRDIIADESTLTGEPQTNKSAQPQDFDSEATYPTDIILKGTILLEGYGTAQVIRVGDSTESGKVYVAAQINEGKLTPLNRELKDLAAWITRASYIVAALVIIGRLITFFIVEDNIEALQLIVYVLKTIMIAVTLIVVAVPEGLPMSVTLSLALSMRKLMREKALPRTLHACETMGAAAVICTDKTGTLTQNKMQVADYQLHIDNDQLLAEAIALNSTANLDRTDADNIRPVGNPTEGALLLWLESKGFDYQEVRNSAKIVDRLPFSTENKYMATVARHAADGRLMLYLKGAPEIIMSVCDLSDDVKRHYEQQLLDYQNKAMRTLAIAYAPLNTCDAPCFEQRRLTRRGLVMIGIVAIADPVRADVPDAINSCLNAGIQVKIVTGDNDGTAREIGRQVGLWSDSDSEQNILRGNEIADMSDDELAQRAPDVKIIARARPSDKERFVKALRARDLVVAVTGDGTNDAPALNSADVGLSMGDGTAVAKEASDMTILDNSFTTITRAVMWGRSLYKNIQRFIMFQLTINIVACLIVLVGSFVGKESPLTVTQMLWVNLIMDTFAAIALASLPPSRNVMNEAPRRVKASILTTPMRNRILGYGGIFSVLMLFILGLIHFFDISSSTGINLTKRDVIFPYELNGYEESVFFTFFVMLQFWNLFNVKAFMTGRTALARLSECKGFVAIALVIFIGQILIVQFGGTMFNVQPLRVTDWLIIIATTSPVLLVGELYRFLSHKRT